MQYLDPKNDLIFRRIFGENPDILRSFLNAVLPLEEGALIDTLEYLNPQLISDLPQQLKNTIVDVRCIDNLGRQFIVEMQMLWVDSFVNRVLLNTSKLYIKQSLIGSKYKVIKPVYSLNIINKIFLHDIDAWYHHYRMAHAEYSHKIIDAIHLVFIEIPKFNAKSYTDKKLIILWLRFLSEITKNTVMISEDLYSVPEIVQAIELTKKSAYSKEQLDAYERYWDIISVQESLIADTEAKAEAKGIQIGEAKGIQIGEAKGIQIGEAKGIQIGNAKGKYEKAIETAKNLKSLGVLTIEQIAQATGLSVEEVSKL